VNRAGYNVRPIVVNDIMVFSPDNMSISVANDVVVMVDVSAADRGLDSTRSVMQNVVVLYPLDVSMRISDHMIVMVDMRRLNTPTVPMRIVTATEWKPELRRGVTGHRTKTQGS
jgi:hypothetical protein